MSREKTLTSDKLTPKFLNYLDKLKSVAEKRGENIAQTALAWILAQHGVTSTLVGASSTEQLMRNISCIHSSPFTTQELEILETF